MLLTVSNLYPRPDQHTRGLFNAQLFREMSSLVDVQNVCLVPQWRPWKWTSVRSWADPFARNLKTVYVPVFYVPVVGRNWNWRTYGYSMRCLDPIISSAENVLVTWLYPDAVALGRLVAQHGRSFWIRAHGTDRFHLEHRVRRRRVLAACEAAEGVITNCQFMARELAVAGVRETKIHVVQNGVDSDVFHFRPRNEALSSLPETCRPVAGTMTVLFVGNLVRIKGPDTALDAFRKLVSAVPDARLAVIGDGAWRRELEQRVVGAGLSGLVTFAGSRPHGEIALWMNAADCLCLASRSEGLPNVVLEALASGLPVVATDVGEVPALLANARESHVVARDGDALEERMAQAIAQVLRENPDRRELARQNGRRHSWERQAEETLSLMQLIS